VIVRWLCLHGQNPTYCGDVDFHLIAHVEKEHAGILQSPCDVRNDNVGSGANTVPFRLHRHGQGHGMLGPVQLEDAVDLYAGVVLKVGFAGHLARRERDLGVALALQDFLVHFVVTTLVSTVAAGSVDDNQAAS